MAIGLGLIRDNDSLKNSTDQFRSFNSLLNKSAQIGKFSSISLVIGS
jgi:hypothetical protein